MIKKILIMLYVIFAVFPAIIFSKAYVEVNAGAGFLNMSDYNASVDSANSANEADGYISKLEKINFSFVPEINAGILSETGMGLLGFYLRDGAIINYGSGGNVTRADGTTVETINRNFSMFYTGLGVRKYYLPGENYGINAYLGLDIGVYYSFNNSEKKDVYYDDGSLEYNINEEWSTCFPGGNIEAGVDWWLNDSLGLNFKAGYRLAADTVAVQTNSNSVLYNKMQYNKNVDYSGFYFTVGTSVGFAVAEQTGKREEYEISEDRPFSVLAAQFYDMGVKLFEQGKYEEAEKQFKNGKAIEPDSAQIDEYLNAINILMAETVKGESVKEKLEIADKLRDAGATGEALVKYKEALAVDKQNAHAIFYISDFAKKADDFKVTAQADFSKGKFNTALQSINKALAYSPDDKESQDMKDKISKAFSDKKEADGLFNKGVEAFEKGEYGDAADDWEKVLEITPDDKETQKNLKIAKERLDEKNKTTEEDVNNALNEARGFFDKGIFDSAKGKCEYILRMDSGNTEAAQMIQKIDEMENKDNNQDSLQKR